MAAAGAAAGVAATVGNRAPSATSSTTPAPRWSLRLFNCDDACRAFINGGFVREIGLGGDTGNLDISRELRAGPNEIAFELVNAHGGIAYGFQVLRDDSIVYQEICGLVFRVGCQDDQRFPPGVAARFTYTVPGGGAR